VHQSDFQTITSSMRFSASLTTAAALTGAVSARPSKPHGKCAPFSGDFSVKAYQVYPENADFDFINCKLYMG
jgi:hypothetical protein